MLLSLQRDYNIGKIVYSLKRISAFHNKKRNYYAVLSIFLHYQFDLDGLLWELSGKIPL